MHAGAGQVYKGPVTVTTAAHTSPLSKGSGCFFLGAGAYPTGEDWAGKVADLWVLCPPGTSQLHGHTCTRDTPCWPGAYPLDLTAPISCGRWQPCLAFPDNYPCVPPGNPFSPESASSKPPLAPPSRRGFSPR